MIQTYGEVCDHNDYKDFACKSFVWRKNTISINRPDAVVVVDVVVAEAAADVVLDDTVVEFDTVCVVVNNI